MTGFHFTNRLGDTVSPYLLQHKNNPVHWFPWGEEALRAAQSLDRPILLSIGYAACHWCHVMAHESFEDESIAALMNELFINIKVDREERPDIDHLYMSALHALGEQGGWPLTMFLSPDGTPFWGGTYFPPVSRYGRPGFPDILRAVDNAWKEKRFALESTGRKLSAALLKREPDSASALSGEMLDQAARRLLSVMDIERGGTRGAPKFPNAPLLELLERAYERSGDPAYTSALDLTLNKLCLGGIYDHIGGGLCRYSTDAEWLVPHFEKMLYDNAQLIDLLAHAYRRTGNHLFRRRIDETIAWMRRDLKGERPAFAASLDADSDGTEGAFYIWSPAQIESVLGQRAKQLCATYGITPGGNWEGHSIPNLLEDEDGSAAESIPPAWLEALRVSRETSRPHPATDDKLLADWNALAVSALARASTLCREPAWLDIASQHLRFIAESMLADDRPIHTVRNGQPGPPAVASDYAFSADAALAVYEAKQDKTWLTLAETLLRRLDRDFLDADSGLYTLSARQTSDIPLRLVSTADEATPNAHGPAIAAFVRLYHFTGDSIWLARADDLLARLTTDTLQNIYGHASILNALDLRLHPVQCVLVGERDEPAGQALIAAATALLPSRKTIYFFCSARETLPKGHPAAGKTAIDGRSTLYICIGETCSLPITDPAALPDAIAGLSRP